MKVENAGFEQSSHDLFSRGAIPSAVSNDHVSSSNNVAPSYDGGEASFHKDGGVMTAGVGSQDMDETILKGSDLNSNFGIGGDGAFFGWMKKIQELGGALGQKITDFASKFIKYFGADEAQGDNLRLQNLGQGERASPPPNVQGDLQLKEVGPDPTSEKSEGGQSH